LRGHVPEERAIHTPEREDRGVSRGKARVTAFSGPGGGHKGRGTYHHRAKTIVQGEFGQQQYSHKYVGRYSQSARYHKRRKKKSMVTVSEA